LVHGLAYLKQKGSDLPIYTDSRIAMGWIEKKVFRSKLKLDPPMQKYLNWRTELYIG